MIVANIMSKKLVTVEPDDRLETLREIFEKLKFHHVLVVDAGKLFGVISDRDLLKAISPRLGTPGESSKDLATLNKKAHQIVTRNPVTLRPDATALEAIGVFNSHRISCIPIVDEAQVPVGILSWRDIFRKIAERKIEI